MNAKKYFVITILLGLLIIGTIALANFAPGTLELSLVWSGL
jgi:hypothetical protein